MIPNPVVRSDTPNAASFIIGSFIANHVYVSPGASALTSTKSNGMPNHVTMRLGDGKLTAGAVGVEPSQSGAVLGQLKVALYLIGPACVAGAPMATNSAASMIHKDFRIFGLV